ncbi:MAG TPA: glycosyltransferase family 4 protein [Rhodanobacteraceae bacterium]|nr:glycosyltransferase family 4 protein [Rhodanobacteraceae bacterium]
MRIAFLCKRRYMGKDVIDDRYARLYEIPFQLARRGHDVLGLCLSYYGDAEVDATHETPPGRLRWLSRSLGATRIAGLVAWPRWSLAHLRAFAPDVLLAASDIPHIIVGDWLARRLKVPLALDLYDNFESFGLARIPGAVPAYRHAVRRAALVSCTSAALADYVRREYAAEGELLAMPSTIDRTVFRPRDKRVSRESLGLPVDAKLVGTAGGLYADKGVGTLYEAYARLAATDPDLHLVLAGPVVASFPPPSHPRVHYLGSIAHERVAELFSALDVGVIYLRDTPFGRYCFPQKAYEMLACGLAVVAADVGAMGGLLAAAPTSLYRPDDAAHLAERIGEQLRLRAVPDIRIDDWAGIVRELDDRLRALVRA